jgi:hypothetical protein
MSERFRLTDRIAKEFEMSFRVEARRLPTLHEI